MSDQPQPNGSLHPRHPGVGSSTSLIAAEGSAPEEGGFLIFFPSGHHLAVGWRQPQPITPTLEAAKTFAAKVVEQLLKANSDAARSDIDRTNWKSVVAAIQRIILDWNGGIQQRIGAQYAKAFGDDPTRLLH